MIAIPVASAMEVNRARSLPVGMPEMSCRKRFLRPCFSRVFSAWKSPAVGWVVDEAARVADRVASFVEAPGGEVVVVRVDTDDAVRECSPRRDGPGDGERRGPTARAEPVPTDRAWPW